MPRWSSDRIGMMTMRSCISPAAPTQKEPSDRRRDAARRRGPRAQQMPRGDRRCCPEAGRTGGAGAGMVSETPKGNCRVGEIRSRTRKWPKAPALSRFPRLFEGLTEDERATPENGKPQVARVVVNDRRPTMVRSCCKGTTGIAGWRKTADVDA